jgi:hypothetical protein
MEKTEKLSKLAISYIQNSLRAAVHDCSDSMHDEEIIKAKFDALADDKFTIEKYIEKFHLAEYVQGVKDVADENGDEVSDWEEYLTNTPSQIPIPYKKIKKFL